MTEPIKSDDSQDKSQEEEEEEDVKEKISYPISIAKWPTLTNNEICSAELIATYPSSPSPSTLYDSIKSAR